MSDMATISPDHRVTDPEERPAACGAPHGGRLSQGLLRVRAHPLAGGHRRLSMQGTGIGLASLASHEGRGGHFGHLAVRRVLDHRRPPGVSDRRKPRDAVVEIATEKHGNDASSVDGRRRPEEGIDAGPGAVFHRPPAHVHAAGAEDEVVVWRGDVHVAMIDRHTVIGLPNRQGTRSSEEAHVGAGGTSVHMENDEDCGGQVDGKLARSRPTASSPPAEAPMTTMSRVSKLHSRFPRGGVIGLPNRSQLREIGPSHAES